MTMYVCQYVCVHVHVCVCVCVRTCVYFVSRCIQVVCNRLVTKLPAMYGMRVGDHEVAYIWFMFKEWSVQ